MMTLTGLPGTHIATPHGMVSLNRYGVATLSSGQADFIDERIEAGALPGYVLAEDPAMATAAGKKKPKTEPGDD